MAERRITVNALKTRSVIQKPSGSPIKDRRLNKRVALALGGRFLADGADDQTLRTVNMSCGGACFVARHCPVIGRQVICYLDDLGRIESEVVRHTDDGFAVRFLVTRRKREKIADRLTWLVNHEVLGLTDEREAPRHASGGPALVRRSDGRMLQCRTIDLSLTGAAFEADGPAPYVGEIVSVGNVRGEVVRTLRTGFAIRYLQLSERS